mmetsp:Transcript_12582/g.43832  ORF Transcript_12582/g.43832 Transcript_12582/m.43832 type:complete len:288 (+) Transcript_12582:1221-2084(+)
MLAELQRPLDLDVYFSGTWKGLAMKTSVLCLFLLDCGKMKDGKLSPCHHLAPTCETAENLSHLPERPALDISLPLLATEVELQDRPHQLSVGGQRLRACLAARKGILILVCDSVTISTLEHPPRPLRARQSFADAEVHGPRQLPDPLCSLLLQTMRLQPLLSFPELVHDRKISDNTLQRPSSPSVQRSQPDAVGRILGEDPPVVAAPLHVQQQLAVLGIVHLLSARHLVRNHQLPPPAPRGPTEGLVGAVPHAQELILDHEEAAAPAGVGDSEVGRAGLLDPGDLGS